MSRVTTIGLCLCLQICLYLPAAGQQVQEKEVSLQKTFIDASREKVLGNYEKAAGLFEQVLDEDEDNAAVAFELGRVYDALEEPEKATKYLKLATELDPVNEWYMRFLADLYQKNNLDEEASELYETLVSRHPDNEHYYFRWAYFLVRNNEINKAIKVYDQLEKRLGINDEVIRRKHTLYLGSGDNKRAARELERLIEAYPRNVEYRHLLASFYEQIGQEEQAVEIYREITRIDPQDARANIALAGESAADSDEIQYLHSLKSVFQNPDVGIDLKIKQLFPFISKVADTHDRDLARAALELTDLLERAHPTEAKAFSAAADLLYYSGRPMQALEKYKRTLELNETVFLVWEQVLYIYHDAGDYDNLARTAEKALDLFPNKALLYYMTGVAKNELGEHQRALSQLDQALLMSGRDGRLQLDIYHRLGLTYYDLDQVNAAFDAFEEALQLHTEAPEVLNDYSYRLAQQNYNLPKAAEMAALANELIPQNKTYLATYGLVLYKQKNFKKARKWMDKALENGGEEDPLILDQYGDLLFQLGATDQAIGYWRKAQENGNNSPLLERKINDRQLYEQ